MPRLRALFDFDVFLCSAAVLAMIVSLVLHEAVGHCGVGWLLGARVHGIEIGLGGGGVAHYDMPPESGPIARAAASAGGIIVDLVAGAISLFVASRVRRIPLRILLVVFAAASLLPTLVYIAYGIYYGVGDAGVVAEGLGLAGLRSMRAGDVNAWIYPMLALPIVTVVVTRLYLSGQEAVFPARHTWHRMVLSAATVGVVMAFAVGSNLARADDVPSGIRAMRGEAATARVDAARGARVLAAARRVRAELQGAPEEQVSAAVRARVEAVIAEPVPASELHREIPLGAASLGLVLLGGIAGLVTFRRRAVRRRSRVDSPAAFALASLAALAVCAVVMSGCAGASGREPPGTSPSGPPRASTATPSAPDRVEAPEPFEAVASPADVVAPFVRPERSSRLAVALPKGRARERWSFVFDPKLDPKLDPAFVVSAGTRVVVQGRPFGAGAARQSAFVLLDTRGHRIAGDVLDGELVRLEPAAGKLYAVGGASSPSAWQLADGVHGPDKLGADDPRAVQGSLAVRAATHGGTHVFMQEAGVEIDDRVAGRQRTVAEPPVVPLDGSIDDDGNLQLLVRQGADLALWTTPIGVGSTGRIRIGPLRRDRSAVPPIAGKALRVLVLDDRLLAVAPDGKTLWERKGALTGGATLTADDRLLVASDTKILAVDPSGRATEIATAPREIFVTPPILTGAGLLLAATGTALHAYAFE